MARPMTQLGTLPLRLMPWGNMGAIPMISRGGLPSAIRSAFLACAGIIASAFLPPQAAAVSTSVVISQVYGAGGSTGATWQNDYVVLFNNGTSAVNVTGWALQFRPASGIWPRVALNGTIAHGHYYLVRLAQGGPFGAPLPTADLVGSVDLDPVSGAIALTNNQSPILTSCVTGPTVVDLVGYGPGMTCSETSPGPPTNSVMAISREPVCIDTDNNASDFHTIPPNPRNSGDANGCNNQAPSIQPIADQIIMEGSTASFFAVATDGNGDAITYGRTGPAWFTINPVSGQCTLAPDLAAAETNGGVYSASVTASDGFVTSSEGFTITVTDLTTAANIPYSGTWPGGVNSHTGELWFGETDLTLGGPLPLCFGRYYASVLNREGADIGHLGTNWLGTFDWKMTINGTDATITDDRGAKFLFGNVTAISADLLNHSEERLVLRGFTNMHRLYRGRAHRVYEFDDATGVLNKILDEHGNSLTCLYTGGRLSGVSDGLGRSLTFSYDALDHLISVGDGTRTVSYGYTGNLLTSYTDAAGHATAYAYTAGPLPGLLTAATTPLGTTPLSWAYDTDGNVASESDAFGHTWTFGVGPGGGCIVSTPTGGTWTAIHDSGIRLMSLQNPLGGITSWTYDASGRPASVTRPLGDLTTLAYDAASGFPSDLGRADGTHVVMSYGSTPIDGFDVFYPTGVSYPDGATESFAYDAAGNLVTHTDPAGQAWTGTYNAHGQPLMLTNPAGGVTTFAYDPQLRMVSRTDNAGNATTFAYDGLDRLVTLTHPDTKTQTFAYDGTNYLVAWTDEAGEVWNQPVDANGRVASRTDPLGHAVQYAYDAMDRVIGVTDALGHTSTCAYDALGRLASSTDRTGRTTSYAYDALSRLVTRTDPGGTATTFAYDANGRLLTATDPLAHAMTYQCDALDRRTRATDPLGNAVQYTYDSMGRVTSANAPLGHAQTYGYDPRGLLTSFFDVTSEAQFPRTSLGEAGSIRDPNLKVWPNGYDAQGRLTSQVDPLSRSTTFAYDNRNRVSHMATPVGSFDPTYDPVGDQLTGQWIDGTGNVSLNYSHDSARRLIAATGVTLGYDAADRITSSNGLTFTHDDEGRLTSETYALGKTVTYAYNPRGLLAQVTDWLGGTTSFAYDAAGRLTGTTRPNGLSTTYQYDSADRLIQKVEKQPGPTETPFATTSLTRDALGRVTDAVRDVPLKPTSVTAENTGYAYDDAGQIVGMSFDGLGRLVSDGTRTFEYDAAGRLAHYTTGTESPTFTYDALGRMLTRSDGAVTQQFVWDYATGTPSLANRVPGPPQTQYFIHTPAGVPLHRVDASGARTFYHYDEAGNAIFLTNESGAVVTAYAYTPTGKTRSFGDTADNPYTYAAASGAFRLGGGLYRYSTFGHYSACYDEVTARCASCPAAPLATMDPRPGLTGIAERPGNDEIASLGRTGHFEMNVGGTFMHELGHNLGLHHNGDRIDPYKNSRSGTLQQQGRVQLDSDWNAFCSNIPWVDVIEPKGSVVSCYKDDLTDKGTSSVFNLVQPGPPSPPMALVGLSDDTINMLFYSLSRNPGPTSSPMALIAISDDVFNQVFAALTVARAYDKGCDTWFTHLDRQLVSPAELLHISGVAPHSLLQQGRVILDFGSFDIPLVRERMSGRPRGFGFVPILLSSPGSGGAAVSGEPSNDINDVNK